MLNRIILIVFVLLVIISAVYALRDSKEFTTSSEQAYELFLESRDLLGKLYIREGIERLQEAVELDSNFAMAHVYLAEQLARYGESEASDFHLKQALQEYDNLKKHEKLYIDFRRLINEGKHDSAITVLQRYVEEFPNRTDGHLALGTIAWEQGEIEKAINEFEKIVEIEPDFAPVYNNLGYLEFGRGNYDTALRYFESYRELLPDQANPHDSKGEILMAIGRYEEALEAFKTAHQIEPRFSFVLYHMAYAYSGLGQFIKAHQSLDRIRQLCQDYREKRELLINRGRTYWNQGDLEMAHQIADSLMQLGYDGPDTNALIWGAMGHAITYAEEDLELARIYLDSARGLIEISQSGEIGNSLVDEKLIWVVFANAQINRFSEDYDSLLELEEVVQNKRFWRPDMTIHFRNLLAVGKYHTGSKKEAFDLIEKSLEINPNHIHSLYISALLHREEGDTETALRRMERILEINRKADSTYYRINRIKEKYEKLARENQAA